MKKWGKGHQKMIVYHGSNSNFKALRVSKKLCRTEREKLEEGIGIYFSTDKGIAASYGKYLYELNLNEAKMFDFRKWSVCINYIDILVENLYMLFKIDAREIKESLAVGIYERNICIRSVGTRLRALIEDDYRLSEQFIKKIGAERFELAMNYIKRFNYKFLLAYMYTSIDYNNTVGVIRIPSPEVVQIVNKTKLY